MGLDPTLFCTKPGVIKSGVDSGFQPQFAHSPYIVLKMQTYRRIDQQAGVYMLAVTSASGLRLALDIFPQGGIHTGLPAFPYHGVSARFLDKGLLPGRIDHPAP